MGPEHLLRITSASWCFKHLCSLTKAHPPPQDVQPLPDPAQSLVCLWPLVILLMKEQSQQSREQESCTGRLLALYFCFWVRNTNSLSPKSRGKEMPQCSLKGRRRQQPHIKFGDDSSKFMPEQVHLSSSNFFFNLEFAAFLLKKKIPRA